MHLGGLGLSTLLEDAGSHAGRHALGSGLIHIQFSSIQSNQSTLGEPAPLHCIFVRR